ncbi:hypothetical protein [Staphylococcus lugdunensis]|uniref:hypothetical protein n=1 Tax=Staphylococcus lugdunensis TaxID=28035 RepID=UPI0001F1300B|nr:hypothetical protein [Staphylococcus lugdunensis]EFU84668.1 hypothetical protein HMPREF0790_0794 [Staphylococcus lugdunensis M23590]SQE72202.1 membrane protein [Staphylococcus lugdunensis]
MNKFKLSIYLLSILPIDYFGLIIDYHYKVMWGYIPLVIISIALGMFIKSFKSYVSTFMIRTIGIVISFICTHVFMNLYETSGYFKPFYASGYAIFSGIISHIIILVTIAITYTITPKDDKS